MNSILRNVRFAARRVWKEGGFSLTAVATLAVCIGANVAVFTVVSSVLLRPLPFPESDRFVLISNQYPNADIGVFTMTSVPHYFERLDALTTLEEQGLYQTTGSTILINGLPQRLLEMTVTPSFFRVLQTNAALGRTFVEDDGMSGASPAVVLSDGLWQELYGGDPGAVGSTIERSGETATIVGVMPPGFVFGDPDVRLWVSTTFAPEDFAGVGNRHSNNWSQIGRTKPGARIEEVQAQVDRMTAAELDRFPEFRELLVNAGFHATVEPLVHVIVRDVEPSLYLLWGGAGFVFLIAVLNLANLSLAASNLRLKEFGTRLAIGAGRMQIVGQLVTEATIVSVLGGAAGLGVGAGALRALAFVGLDGLPRAEEIQMNGASVGMGILLALLAGIVIGVLPAVHVLTVRLGQVLQEEGRSGTGGRTHSLIRRGLVVAQVSVACVLLIGAVLLSASFSNLLDVDPGFDPENVVTATLSAPDRYAGGPELRSLLGRVLAAIRSVPGVEAVGATNPLPFSGTQSADLILAEGYAFDPGESIFAPRQNVVTPGYFDAMGIGLGEGRYFEESDDADATPAVIVDERLAQRYWGDESPIGRRMYEPEDPSDLLGITEDTTFYTVVGVVEAVIFEDLRGETNLGGAFYFPVTQRAQRRMTFAIRTAGNPMAVVNSVRAALAEIDPELPLFDVRTMRERVETSLASRRAAAWLASSFAAVAILLSAIGIYGVLAYLVTQRSRELGIRIALGSSSRQVFRLVLREGLVLLGVGLVLGLTGALALGRIIESQIYGITPMDPMLLGAVAGVLAAVALAASSLPAFRATKLQPNRILNG